MESSSSTVYFKNIEKWFRKDVIDDLSIIRCAICAEPQKKMRRYYWLCFGEIVKKYSNTRTSTFKLHIKEKEKIIEMPNNIVDDFVEKIQHTLWLMPTQNACEAMERLLKEDNYFRKFKIINLSASGVGAGANAFRFLEKGIKESENTDKKGSIAITVNKLTIGVTVKKWSGVFVLKDLTSPEQYFQAIFRVQTPLKEDGKILKKEGLVFDFNIDRAASLLLKYAKEQSEGNSKKLEIARLIVKYLPIFINGDTTKKISEEVFYQLAELGDVSAKTLSKRITDVSTVTAIDNDQALADMMNDKEASEILKKVFAHAKFTKPNKETKIPAKSEDGFDTIPAREGTKAGQECGEIDFDMYEKGIIKTSGYKRFNARRAATLFNETFMRTNELSDRALKAFKKEKQGTAKAPYVTFDDNSNTWDAALDREVQATLLKNYRAQITAEYLPAFYKTIDQKFGGNYQKYVDYLWNTSSLMKKGAKVYLTKANIAKDAGLQYGQELNALRNRAHAMTKTGYNLNDICDEWSREFYMEGRRRSDLIRFDMFTGKKYNWAWKGGVPNGQAVDSHFKYYPIPLDDINNNENMHQNADY